jgi:hypothetical protein
LRRSCRLCWAWPHLARMRDRRAGARGARGVRYTRARDQLFKCVLRLCPRKRGRDAWGERGHPGAPECMTRYFR